MKSRGRSVLLVLALLAAFAGVGAGGSAGAVAGADAAPPDALTLTGPATALAHTTTQLTATLTAAGAPAPTTQVTLESLAGSTWTTVGTATTDDTGQAVFTVPVRLASEDFRAVFTPVSGDPVVSAPFTLRGTRQTGTLTMASTWRVVDETWNKITVKWVSQTHQPIPGSVLISLRRAGETFRPYTRITLNADGIGTLNVRPRVDLAFRATGAAGQWWATATSPSYFMDNVPPIPRASYPSAAPRPRYIAVQARAVGAGPSARITAIPMAVWNNMVGRSWHRGCPIGRADLRLIRINYWGFDGYRHRGEMVVRTAIAGKTVKALSGMYAGKFPIRVMYRVDKFGWSKASNGANDLSAMQHDNTSAFNCRSVTGSPGRVSPHSYGRAIDLNTWENPYVSAKGVVPDVWWLSRSNPRYAWRDGNHPVVKIWRAAGFRWTYAVQDSQHWDGRQGPGHTPVMTFTG